jgi:hypothetical protein
MTTTGSVPRIATWILKHFGSGPDVDTTIGDLMERYHKGRSRSWYWRQVMKTVVVSAFSEIRGHKVLAARAVVVGMTVMAVLEIFFSRLYTRLPSPDRYAMWLITRKLPFPQDDWLIYEPYFQYFESIYWIGIPLLMTLIAGLVTGWTVARFHRPHHRSIVLFICVVAFVSGVLPNLISAAGSDDVVQSMGFLSRHVVVWFVGILTAGLGDHSQVTRGPEKRSQPWR